MLRMRVKPILWVLSLAFVSIQAGAQPCDLAIKDAVIFDTHTGAALPHKNILITGGVITAVTPAGRPVKAGKVIEAHGRFVTPGFIDVHTHLTNVLGDYDQAPLNIRPDSVAVYRRRHAAAYLPYGITTVRMVGEPEQWIPMTLEWQTHPLPRAPDVYTCGAALVSREPGHRTYIGHVAVTDPADAAAKVRQYYRLGIRDIKLYWRLQYPDLISAFHQAQALHMHVCAHIDRRVTARDSVLALGVKDLEHIHPYGVDVLDDADLARVQLYADSHYGTGKGAFVGWQMEVWNQVGENNARMAHSIDLLKKYHASLTPTLHIFAQALGLSYMKETLTIEHGSFDTRDFSRAQLDRCRRGFAIMGAYVKKMYEQGVQLNLGTDCPEGGRSALSELLLLNRLHIPMADVLKIATINSARAIGREALYGSIEPGKKADLIIFARSPLQDPVNLLGAKEIIKDGNPFN
jgi:imidazolonepropionase-like amidohydrolase